MNYFFPSIKFRLTSIKLSDYMFLSHFRVISRRKKIFFSSMKRREEKKEEKSNEEITSLIVANYNKAIYQQIWKKMEKGKGEKERERGKKRRKEEWNSGRIFNLRFMFV